MSIPVTEVHLRMSPLGVPTEAYQRMSEQAGSRKLTSRSEPTVRTTSRTGQSPQLDLYGAKAFYHLFDGYQFKRS